MKNKGLPWSWFDIFMCIFTIIYFIFPIDFIPDVILGLGQLDDFGLILYTLTNHVMPHYPNSPICKFLNAIHLLRKRK